MIRQRSNEMDMLSGPIWNKLIAFALPIAITGILQQLFNAADVAVAGRFAGSSALAAVGANTSNTLLFTNFIAGSSVGANVVVAMLIGRGKREKVQKTVGGVIGLAIVLGLIMLALGQVISAPLLKVMGTPDSVFSSAAIYLRIYLIAIPFLAVYNYGAALLRSKGDTRRPLYCLIFSGVVNVILNLIFVIVFNLGVIGVATATVISAALSASMILILLIREKGMMHLDIRNIKPRGEYIGKILRNGVPAGLQLAVFSIANMFVQAGVNSFGDAAIAGASAELNFESFSWNISSGFAQGAVTFTSQNYAAGRMGRCDRVFRIAMLEGMVFTAILSMVFVVFREPLFSLFTTDPEVVDYAMRKMFFVAAFEFLTATYEVSSGALRGLGKALLPSVLTILGTVVFRMVWFYTVFAHIHTYESLMLVYTVSWIFTGIATIIARTIVARKIKKKFAQGISPEMGR